MTTSKIIRTQKVYFVEIETNANEVPTTFSGSLADWAKQEALGTIKNIKTAQVKIEEISWEAGKSWDFTTTFKITVG